MVSSRRSSARGFTLIELLVGIAVTGFLLLVAAPYTTGWLDNSEVVQSSALLQQAMTRSKAIAVSNPLAIVDGSAASYMCANAGTVYVQLPTATVCGSGFVWRGSISAETRVLEGTSNWICTAFNTRGLVVAHRLNGTDCSTSTNMTISKGQSSNARSFY